MWRNAAPALLGFTLALPLRVLASDETSVILVEGPGREQVQAACSMCHSVDYIVMNSPFLDKAGWEKTIVKMVNVFGAPLTTQETAAIVAYLDRHYGK